MRCIPLLLWQQEAWGKGEGRWAQSAECIVGWRDATKGDTTACAGMQAGQVSHPGHISDVTRPRAHQVRRSAEHGVYILNVWTKRNRVQFFKSGFEYGLGSRESGSGSCLVGWGSSEEGGCDCGCGLVVVGCIRDHPDRDHQNGLHLGEDLHLHHGSPLPCGQSPHTQSTPCLLVPHEVDLDPCRRDHPWVQGHGTWKFRRASLGVRRASSQRPLHPEDPQNR